jgi:hypothetical protein
MTGEFTLILLPSIALNLAVIKTNRTMEISMENDLPLISLVQSVRHNLPLFTLVHD